MNYSVIIGFITFLIFVSFAIYNYDGDFDPTNNYISDLSKDGQTSKDYFQLSIVFLMLFILAYVVSWAYRDPMDMTHLRIPFIVGSFFLISAFLFTRPHNDFIHLSMVGISAAMFSYMMYRGDSRYGNTFNQVSSVILPLFLAGLVVSYDHRPIYEWLSFALLFIWIGWWNYSNEKMLDNSPPVVCKFIKQR
jgi:hypothetical membrane protein